MGKKMRNGMASIIRRRVAGLDLIMHKNLGGGVHINDKWIDQISCHSLGKI